MHKRGDGTGYFGPPRQSNANLTRGSVAERHVNTSDILPEYETPFGVIGGSQRYTQITEEGQART